MKQDRIESLGIFLLPLLCVFPPLLVRIRGLQSPPITAFTMSALSLSCVLLGLLLLYLNQPKRKQALPASLARIGTIATLVFASIDIGFGGVDLIEAAMPSVESLPRRQRLLVHLVFALGTTSAIGLVIWLLKENAVRILAASYGAVFVSTLILPDQSRIDNWVSQPANSAARGDRGPSEIYIILDAMTGPEGVDRSVTGAEAVYRLIRDFHDRHGFLLFGRAFSRHYHTRDSIPHTLNHAYSPDAGSTQLVSTANNSNTVIRNAAFDRIADSGRAVTVYQGPFINYCRHPAVQRCVTLAAYNPYNGYLPPEVEPNLLVASVRGARHALAFRTILGKYLSRPLGALVDRLVPGEGSPYLLPKHSEFFVHSTDLWFDEFQRDVLASERGGVFLAHFVFPHYPYLLDEACRPKRKSPKSSGAPYEDPSSPESRRRARNDRYHSYYQQVECAFRKLDGLIRGLDESDELDDSVIVLMGDHGSRMSPGSRLETLEERDYVDNFSTLFSVRRPGLQPGYEPRLISVQQLFGAALSGDITGALDDPEVTVMLESENDARWHPTPMPDFSFAPLQ